MQLSKDLFMKLKASVSFFNTFTSAELLALLRLASSETFKDGDIIFKEKTLGDKMYIILSGTVRISKYIGNNKEEVLVKLKSGACFGEMGIIDQSPRSATATVEGGDAVMLVVKESSLSQHNQLLAYKLYKNFSIMLAGRLRETNEKLQNLSISDSGSKAQLKELIKKKTESGGSLENANLRGADLSETFLNSTNMDSAILVNATLNGAKCKDTNFTNARFINSEFNSGTFEGCKFETTDFTAAKLEDVSFVNCSFNNTNFQAADLSSSFINNEDDTEEME